MQEMQPKGAQAVFSAHLLWEGASSTGPCRGRMQVWSKALKLPAPPAVTEEQKKDPDPLSQCQGPTRTVTVPLASPLGQPVLRCPPDTK